ncbi:N-acetylglucosaminyldiphosphoundecaprenol N-acetyl-beta-D-mannosaminyltransferase [Microbacterium hydrothermale]|nr:N-acetylglucosaminyldiphosphoundecaprenol N-acetyl-beta-D-mannosaminyltransferase [Microbacterium hydrothermale]
MRTVSLPWGLGMVTPLDASEACDWILGPAEDLSRPRILGNLNLHALHLSLEDGPVQTLTSRSDVTLVDGWPILLLARMASPESGWPTTRERIGSTDWLSELVQRDPEIAVAAVGGTPETATRMTNYINSRTRSMRWQHFDGFNFAPATKASSETGIPDVLARADVVLVGLGMPTQEQWILDHLALMKGGAVVANVGGCFDYFAGTQRLAPRWMGRLGLEWLYRLAHSPRRLAKRYLIEPFLLLSRLARRGQRPHV